MLIKKHNIDKLFYDKLSNYQDDIPELNFEEIQNKFSEIEIGNKIDNLFSDKLLDYHEEVPVAVFENIKDKINKNSGQNEIDNLFAKYLNNYQETPPNYILPQINNKLNNNKSTYTLQKIAATIAILIAFGLGYFTSEVKDKSFITQNVFYDSIFKQQNRESQKNNEIIEGKSISNINNKKSKKINNNIKASNKDKKQVVNFAETRAINNNSSLYDFKDKTKKTSIQVKNKTDNTKNDNKAEKVNYKQLLAKGNLLSDGSYYNDDFVIESKNNKKSRWTFGTKISPVFSFSNNSTNEFNNDIEIVANNNENTSDVNQAETSPPPIASSRNRNVEDTQNPIILKTSNVEEVIKDEYQEQSIATFTSGLNVNFQISKRWSVQSGLYYSNKRQTSTDLTSSTSFVAENEMRVYTPAGDKYIDQPIINANDIDNESIIGQNSNETYYSLDMNYVSTFKYIELPILFKFKIIDKKIDLEVLSGISTNFLVGNRSSIMIEEKEIWKGVNEDMSPLLYDATFGFGLNYNFYENFNFSLEPIFKYNLVKQNVNIQTYPYSFAVFAGLSYTF